MRVPLPMAGALSFDERYGPKFCTSHAEGRFLERFGVEATRDEWRQVILDILDTIAGSRTVALLVARTDTGMEQWRCKMSGREVIVTYSPSCACIVTIWAANDRAKPLIIRRRPRRSEFQDD